MLTIYADAVRLKAARSYRLALFAEEEALTHRVGPAVLADDFLAGTVAIASAIEWAADRRSGEEVVVRYGEGRSPATGAHEREDIEAACEAARRAAAKAALVVSYERLAQRANPATLLARTESDYHAGRTLAAVGRDRFETSRPLLANATIRWQFEQARGQWDRSVGSSPTAAQLVSSGRA